MPTRRIGGVEYSPTHSLPGHWMKIYPQSHNPAHYARGNNPRCRSKKRLGGPQGQSRLSGEETNLLPLPGNKPRFPGCQTRSVITTPTELPPAILVAVQSHCHDLFFFLSNPLYWKASGYEYRIILGHYTVQTGIC